MPPSSIRDSLRLATALNERVLAQHSLSLATEVLDDTDMDFRRVGELVSAIYSTSYGNRTALRRASSLELEAKSLRADGHYIARSWNGGVHFASEVVANIHNDDFPRYQTLYRSIRCLLLCNAHLGKLDTTIQSRSFTLLDTGLVASFFQRAALRESIGRINVLFGNTKEGWEHLAKAEMECQESERAGVILPVFLFQVIRGRLITLRNTPVRQRDLDYAVELIKDALRIVRVHKLKRYCMQVEELIRQLGLENRLRDEIGSELCDEL